MDIIMVKIRSIILSILSLFFISGCASETLASTTTVSETPIATETTEDNDYHYLTYNGKEYKYNSTIASILFMGVDSTDGDGIGRADSMQLYLLDRAEEKMEVISISRDIQTPIRLFDLDYNDLGWATRHLALAYTYGATPENGAMLTCQAVSRLLNNVPINYFVAVDLTKLPLIHSVVGELDVVVPNDSLVDVNPDWTKGANITLTNDNVELFLRNRDIDVEFSNNTRMERQRVYLDSYFEKINEMLNNNFEKTVSLLYNVSSELITNITLSDIESFANMLMTYSYDSDSDFYTIEGTDVIGDFHNEYYVDEKLLKELIVELFYRED